MFKSNHEKSHFTHFNYNPDAPLLERLPSGVYTPYVDSYGVVHFETRPIHTDGLVQLHKGVTSQVIQEVDFFFTPEVRERFRKRNIMHRRGILLHGPQGTGKSCTIYQLIDLLIQKDVIVLYEPSPVYISNFISSIREHDDDRHILVIWEEFDDKLDDYESVILQVLDGAISVNNIIFVATTNYLDDIPARVKNRPSRFARLIEVSYPDAEGRREFLMNKMLPEDLEEQDLDRWVELTEGMVIDHMKELITSVCCLLIPLEEAAARLKEMNEYDFDESDDDNEIVHMDEQCYEDTVTEKSVAKY